MGLLVILAVGVVAWQVSDWPGALAAAATVALSPIELQWSRTISPEIASSAFAVVGMAYAFRYLRTGGRCAIALASSSVAASILIKLLGIFTIPALFLAVGFRHCKTYRSGYAFWLPLAQDTLLVIGTLVPVIIGVSVFLDQHRFGTKQFDSIGRQDPRSRRIRSPDRPAFSGSCLPTTCSSRRFCASGSSAWVPFQRASSLGDGLHRPWRGFFFTVLCLATIWSFSYQGSQSRQAWDGATFGTGSFEGCSLGGLGKACTG